MSRPNQRAEMEKKRHEFLQAFEQDADLCRQSVDLQKSASDQDQRLTTKHIKTLTFLQDIVNENKSLKTRNEQLEAELVECPKLHAAARDAPEKLKLMQQQYLDKMDEINQMLLRKHETELTRVVNEKMKLEKVWEAEKISLQNENRRLKATLSDLTGSLSQAKENSDRAQLVQLKLDALSEENALLKEDQHRYLQENENLRSEVQSLHRTKHLNEKLNNDLKSVEQNYKELLLKFDKLMKEVEDDKPYLMDQVKSKLTKLSQEKRILTERCQQQQAENEKLRRTLLEYAQQMKNWEIQREKLIDEMGMLREEMQKKRARPSGDKDFREFVNLKRELAALKDENEELTSKMQSRVRVRAQSLLPTLKGPEFKIVVDRRASTNSILSKKV